MSVNTKRSAFGYTLGEEIANAVTHGLGALLAAAGTAVMIVFSALARDPWKVVSSAVYGFSLIVLFSMSTMYHALAPVGARKAKQVFQVFDHTSIFLLIAGSYTIITLGLLRGAVGWILFGVVWAVCLLGIVLNAADMRRFKKLSMVCYLAAGWAVVAAIVPMVQAMAEAGLWLLLVGGVCYTIGIVFYKLKKVRFMHSVWHLFVLAGAVLHYFSFLFFVVMA